MAVRVGNATDREYYVDNAKIVGAKYTNVGDPYYTTVAAALTAAASDGTTNIVVEPGVYNETVTTSIANLALTMYAGVWIDGLTLTNAPAYIVGGSARIGALTISTASSSSVHIDVMRAGDVDITSNGDVYFSALHTGDITCNADNVYLNVNECYGTLRTDGGEVHGTFSYLLYADPRDGETYVHAARCNSLGSGTPYRMIQGGRNAFVLGSLDAAPRAAGGNTKVSISGLTTSSNSAIHATNGASLYVEVNGGGFFDGAYVDDYYVSMNPYTGYSTLEIKGATFTVSDRSATESGIFTEGTTGKLVLRDCNIYQTSGQSRPIITVTAGADVRLIDCFIRNADNSSGDARHCIGLDYTANNSGQPLVIDRCTLIPSTGGVTLFDDNATGEPRIVVNYASCATAAKGPGVRVLVDEIGIDTVAASEDIRLVDTNVR